MKKKSMKLKSLLVLVMMVVMMFGSTITVSASDTPMTVPEVTKYLAEVENYNSVPVAMKIYVTRNKPANMNGYTSAQLADGTDVWFQSSDVKAIGDSISKETSVEEKQNTQQGNVQSDIADITVNPDIGMAQNMLSGFSGIINMVVSIIIYVLTIGMTLFTAFDLSYIAFPVFRNKCEDAKANGTKGVTRTDSKTGETKLRIVTDEAQYAVLAADTIQSGQNPFWIYFKKRFISILLLAIIIFILLTGNIGVFTTIALKLVSGLLSIIQGI